MNNKELDDQITFLKAMKKRQIRRIISFVLIFILFLISMAFVFCSCRTAPYHYLITKVNLLPDSEAIYSFKPIDVKPCYKDAIDTSVNRYFLYKYGKFKVGDTLELKRKRNYRLIG